MFLREGLSPDATIETSFPADRFPAANAITARMLLSHTSGIPDEMGRRVRELGEEMDPADMLRALQPILAAPTPPIDERIAAIYNRTTGLDFAPGTAWCYSNTGYLMLGRMLERATGQPVDGRLDRHFGDVAPSLSLDDGRNAEFPAAYPDPWPIHWSHPWVAGALVANARDAVAAFNHIARHAEFVRMQEWAEAPRCPIDIVAGDDYGLGLQRYVFEGIGEAIGHDGHIIARSILFQLDGSSYLVHTTAPVGNPELRAITRRLLGHVERSP